MAQKEKSAIGWQEWSDIEESGGWSKKEWGQLMQDSSLTLILSGKEAIWKAGEYAAMTQVAKEM